MVKNTNLLDTLVNKCDMLERENYLLHGRIEKLEEEFADIELKKHTELIENANEEIEFAKFVDHMIRGLFFGSEQDKF